MHVCVCFKKLTVAYFHVTFPKAFSVSYPSPCHSLLCPVYPSFTLSNPPAPLFPLPLDSTASVCFLWKSFLTGILHWRLVILCSGELGLPCHIFCLAGVSTVYSSQDEDSWELHMWKAPELYFTVSSLVSLQIMSCSCRMPQLWGVWWVFSVKFFLSLAGLHETTSV